MRFAFIFFFCIIRIISFAQNDLTDNFAYNVKTIDDFIDRFDFKRNTEFEKYFIDNYPEEELTRKKLVLSLFNFKNKSFYGNPDVKTFVEAVTDSIDPVNISFYDSSWYAEAECKIYFKSKPEKLILILQVAQDKNRSVKWSIVSAHASFLGKNQIKNQNDSMLFNNEYMKNRINDQSRYFLHPVSHALDFMNIDLLFTQNKNVFEKYVNNSSQNNQLDDLISKVKNSEIKFVQINTISYHLLQIPGWIAIVDYFNRNEKNSGWLINTLFKANGEQKIIYLKDQLNVQTN